MPATVLSLGVMVVGSCSWAVAQASATRPEGDQALPRLVDAPGVVDAYLTRRGELEEALDAATRPLDRAESHLALANWWLGPPISRPATRWLLGLDSQADRNAIAEAAKVARRHLEQADKLLSDMQDDQAGKRRYSHLKLSAGALKPFAEVFLAASTTEAQPDRDAWASAARGLAFTRETDNPQMAAAALLWQSFAWMKTGDADRVLATLPEALAKPEELPYDFMSRLLRCRVLMMKGRYAPAMALTLQIQDMAPRWVRGEGRKAGHDARRLAQWLEVLIAEDWKRHLKSPETNGRILQAQIDETRSAILEEDGTPADVYYMNSATPILVLPPSIEAMQRTPSTDAPSPEIGSQPAATSPELSETEPSQ